MNHISPLLRAKRAQKSKARITVKYHLVTLNFLFKKPQVSLDFSSIGLDIHSHLIPGIDDGAKSLEVSVALIRQMMAMGFTRIITTPHVMSGIYPNTQQDILKGFVSLKRFLQKESIKIPISVAAEYFLDQEFLELLESEPLLTLPNNHLLVEVSQLSVFDGFYDCLFRIQLKGYKIILAHPERYFYYHNNYKAYDDLKSKGVLFQVNVLSLLGYYGKPIKKIAHQLVEDNLVELLGTDIHHKRHTQYIQDNITSRELQKILSNHAFQNSELFSEQTPKASPVFGYV
jgi:protein-tyrosine phosphatase